MWRFFQRRIDSYSPASKGGSSNDTWTHDLFDRNGDKNSRLANNPLAARLGEMYFNPRGALRVTVEHRHQHD